MHITDVVSSVGILPESERAFASTARPFATMGGKRGFAAGLAMVAASTSQQATPVKRHRLSAVKNTEFLDRLAAQDSVQKFNDDLAMVTSSLRQHRNLMPSVKALVCNYLTNMKGEFPRCVRTFGDIPVKDPTQ